MRTISAMDLRRRTGEVLDRAAAGERILVERDHRPLAVLVSYEDALRLEDSPEERTARALAALERLEALAQRMAETQPGPAANPPTAALIRDERARDRRG